MTSTALKDLLDRSPFLELTYRALLWTALGWILANQIIYAKDDTEFPAALDRYIQGIGNWDKAVVICLVAASVVYGFRSIEFSSITGESTSGRWIKHVFGALAKISGDMALASFGAGVAILAALSRVPVRVGGDLQGYLKFSGSLGLIIAILSTLAVCYLISRFGPETWLYRWQTGNKLIGRAIVPMAVIAFITFYALAL